MTVTVDSSCREFMEAIARKEPVPGGGSVSAMVGAFGAALSNMVAAYTVGKKKYADVKEDMKAYIEELNGIQERLLELVHEDMEAFEPLSKLYAMKSDDPEEKKRINEEMQKALYNACMGPMAIIDQCGRAIELAQEIVKKGNKLVISDAGASAVTCKAAMEAASISVYINTSSFDDKELADKINGQCAQKIVYYGAIAEAVYAETTKKFMVTVK